MMPIFTVSGGMVVLMITSLFAVGAGTGASMAGTDADIQEETQALTDSLNESKQESLHNLSESNAGYLSPLIYAVFEGANEATVYGMRFGYEHPLLGKIVVWGMGIFNLLYAVWIFKWVSNRRP